MKVSEILRTKGDGVVTVAPTATVAELVDLLRQHNVGAVVVSADGRTVDGIVSERDIVRRLGDVPDVLSARVDSIMTSSVTTSDASSDVTALARTMTDQRIRHVPIVDEDGLVGIVSIGDIVKSRIEQLTFERDQLESYVSSAGVGPS